MKFQKSGVIEVDTEPSINSAYILDALWQAIEGFIDSDQYQEMVWDELGENPENEVELEHLHINIGEIMMRHIAEPTNAKR
jgi:hypothetical protein